MIRSANNLSLYVYFDSKISDDGKTITVYGNEHFLWLLCDNNGIIKFIGICGDGGEAEFSEWFPNFVTDSLNLPRLYPIVCVNQIYN